MKKEKVKQDSFFKELGCFMSPYKIRYFCSVIISIIAVTCSVLSYYFMGRIVAILFDGDISWKTLIIFCVMTFLFKILYAVLLNLSTWISHGAAYYTLRDIRYALSDKMTRLPSGYFEQRGSGRLKTLLVDHVEGMEKTLAHMIPEFTANLLAPLACVVWMLFIDWRLALCSIVWIMIGFSVTAGMMKNYDEKYAGQIKALKNMNQSVTEYVNGIEVIKNFGVEEQCYKKYSDSVYNYANYNINWQRELQKYSSFGMAIAPFSLFPVLIAGLIFYANGSILPSEIFMMIILTFGLFGPLMNAMNYFDQIASMGTNAKEINSVLKYPELKRGNVTINNGASVKFDNVSFSYIDKSKMVLQGVSFNIPEGSMFALVGPSGSGKSTIGKLIAGYWDVIDGSIYLGENNINSYSQDALNKLVAYVDQDTFLFDTSIKDNIRIGKLDATDDDVINASKRAGCHEFISQLENGYDTLAGECGNKLSGGERQRIAIARAIIKDAPIIVMDEATASTDPENEAYIQKALSDIVKGKTLIVVAHRLSTIVNADTIAYVSGGKIISIGSHDELIKTCPEYKNLWDISEGGKND